MKHKTQLLGAFAFLATCAVTHADITGWTYNPDPTGAIVCNPYPYFSAGTVTMYGVQTGPGSMGGVLTADTPADPTVGFSNFVDNNTGFAWGAYHVDVLLTAPFTISVPVSVTAPGGWSVLPYNPNATFNGTSWETSFDMVGGPPIQPTPGVPDELDFSYAIHFTGLTTYTVTEVLTPIPVPEPATLGLLALGGMVVLARRSRRNCQ